MITLLIWLFVAAALLFLGMRLCFLVLSILLRDMPSPRIRITIIPGQPSYIQRHVQPIL